MGIIKYHDGRFNRVTDGQTDGRNCDNSMLYYRPMLTRDKGGQFNAPCCITVLVSNSAPDLAGGGPGAQLTWGHSVGDCKSLKIKNARHTHITNEKI